jgi:hypothetical protein
MATSKSSKVTILTILPKSYIIHNIPEVFPHASNYIINKAKPASL